MAAMAVGPFDMAMERLKAIIDHLEGSRHVTLGNEIFTHPKVADILLTTRKILPEYFSYRNMGGGVPTTAIALLRRKNRKDILEILKEAGCHSFDFTLLGGKENHNKLAKNRAAFDALTDFAHWIKGQGMGLGINLMMNKTLIDDWNEVAAFVQKFPNAAILPVVPGFLPVDRLRGFQEHRAQYCDYMKIAGRLSPLGIDEESFFAPIDDLCESSVLSKLRNSSQFDYQKDEEGQPRWMFLNIVNNYDIFYGNAGAHTRKLGNILVDEPEKLLEKIRQLPPNYDWSAYYDIDMLPPMDDLLAGIMPLSTDFVYPRIQDCIYSWLDARGTSNIIIF